MGGLFSQPSPAPLPPSPPPADPAEDERKRRLQAIERRRRGRAGTIATSERGVLTPDDAAGLKTRLGE